MQNRTPAKTSDTLPGQLLQDFLPKLLCFSKKFLIFEEQSVHLQRAIGREALAQNHVADAHRIGKDCFFAEFLEGSRGIVVVHGKIVIQPSGSGLQALGFGRVSGNSGCEDAPLKIKETVAKART